MITVGFIGAGNMGYAIMRGVATSGLCDSSNGDKAIKLSAFDVNTQQTERLKEYGVTACASEKDIMESCKYVFLAVKPQMFEEVLKTLSPYATKDTVFVSIAAGITDKYISDMTVENAKVVLVMPNTPLLLGEGASALSRNEEVTDEEFDVVLSIFSACGTAKVISKDKMKEIIAINGSSPAFTYLFAKCFMEYACSVGIDENVAKELFAKTLIGSAKMITDSGYSIDELITMVSSKGGTTIAGLNELYNGGFEQSISDCCKACTKRAYELSK